MKMHPKQSLYFRCDLQWCRKWDGNGLMKGAEEKEEEKGLWRLKIFGGTEKLIN